MQPREYQKRAIASVLEAMELENAVLMQAPTASGKTVVFSNLIKNLLTNCPEGKILILAHRQELIGQAKDKLEKVWEDHHGISTACAGFDANVDTDSPVVIASVQTLSRRLRDLPFFNLCIVDEAHRLPPLNHVNTQYIKLLNRLWEINPEMRLLGVTATPYRLGHGYIYGDECKEGGKNIFSTLHHQISVKELTAGNFLSPMRGRVAIPDELYGDLRKVGISNGDYSDAESGKIMAKEVYIQSAVRTYREYAEDRKHVMIFCVTIEHAELMRDAFKQAGYVAEVVHSLTPKADRKRILKEFVDGHIHFLCNVNVLIEGFDAPLTDCIIMARPTMSASLYLQQAGRGLRIADGKTDCLLIDMVGNCLSFGVDFDDIKIKAPRLSAGDAPYKICPNCQSPIPASAKDCLHCGYVYPPAEFKLEEVEDQRPYVEIEFNKREEGLQMESEIISASLSHYTSKNQNHMLRLTVQLNNLLNPVYHYLNFDESAHWYTKEKSGSCWWKMHGEMWDVPESNEEALQYFDAESLVGMRVGIKQEGKYNKIIGW